MDANSLPAERAAVVATIDPDAYTANTYTSDWVDMGRFASLMAIIMAGDLGTNATLDAKLQQATDDQGAGAKDITGKAITQLTQAGADSDKQAIINVRPEELDLDNEFRYVRLSATLATATSDFGAILLGFDTRHGIGSANDLASVDEIVA